MNKDKVVRRPRKVKQDRSREAREAKRLGERSELERLEKQVAHFDHDVDTFEELPISRQSAQGLKAAAFSKMTEIQRKAIPLGLQGKDLLASAKTGSGKTLAFLVPLLECLYRQGWTELDGLGALVISPTRELALQIFGVLCKIGRLHSFSAGLVIGGGKSITEEKVRIQKMNILIATPGRLLQHLDQTVGLEIESLKMLIFDEADRCLDMGFKNSINAILSHCPKSRQTMLFSATMSHAVSDIARLSLREPAYVGLNVHREKEEDLETSPEGLKHHYLIVDLPLKLDMLYSFIKTHLKAKILVFLSSCKQIQFVYEVFCKLRPGLPLLCLHGKQKQMKRADIYAKFNATREACLFATDVASRGLDFPAVDWVVQVDAPEDVDTYIHRVGRTARYERSGHGLLFLCPSEEMGMMAELARKKIQMSKLKTKASQHLSIASQCQNFCFQDVALKELGQKAVRSFAKSLVHQKNKQIFDVHAYPLEEFAQSLGLPGAPKMKFIESSKRRGTAQTPVEQSSSDEGGKASDESDKDGSDDRDEFMTIGRKNHDLDESLLPMHESISKRKMSAGTKKKGIIKSRPQHGEKLTFDDIGQSHPVYEFRTDQKPVQGEDISEHLALEDARLRAEDLVDRETAKAKRREKRLRLKERIKEANDDLPAKSRRRSPSPEASLDVPSREGPPSKKARSAYETAGLDETEILAMRLLRGD